jgi:NodT family efflux transporter outer membrane factor (OMF) lipoprotein
LNPRACFSAGAAAALLAACAVGPDYHRPPVELPEAWRTTNPWHAAQPNDAELKGNWWVSFGDAQLNALIERALENNQNLKLAAARLEQARAEVTIAQSAWFPQIDAGANAARIKTSANRPESSYGVPNQSTVQNDFVLTGSVSYELDLFGRVRRSVEAARAGQQQSEADFENARLVLAAQVASDYFALRELDAEIDVLRTSIESQRRSLDIISARHELGFATGLDLAQQQALLEASEAQIELLKNQRAQNEHAIATLIAVPAPSFSLAPQLGAPSMPEVPIGLPSDLLQRRPDVASAERAMAAANARIGVARAAYFPAIELAPNFGTESSALSNLLSAPSRWWSLGASATATLFNAGATGANVRIAAADYTAAVALYRQTVLGAMEEVENGVIGLDALSQAERRSAASEQSAQRALDIANDRYAGGVDTFLDVFTAQQTVLADRRQTVQIRGQRMLTAVYLVKALGGGWAASPTPRS